MQPANDAAGSRIQLGTQTIQRIFWIVLGLLLAVLVTFAGYYIWDRYIHAEGQPAVELNIASMEQAIHTSPQDPELRVVLAESYLSVGENARALEQAEQVLGQYPQDAGALLIAGIARVRLDQPEAALEPLQTFVTLRKDGPMARTDQALEAAYYFLGQSYLLLGRPAEAIPMLEAALQISAVDADALYQLGLAYNANGQPELAVQSYQDAVRLVPDFDKVYEAMIDSYSALDLPDYIAYARGMLAFSRKDYPAAVSHLEQATEALPNFAPAFLGLGLTYESMENLQPALLAVERALELDPGDFATRQALGRMQAAQEAAQEATH
jgi:tetratricopeptide (TPR) repeat protein